MSEPHVGGFLRPDLEALRRHDGVYGTTDEERVLRLADALTTGPLWAELSGGVRLAVRTDPVPLIAVLGAPDARDQPALDALSWQVADCVDRLLAVSWEGTVGLVEILAKRLHEQLGDDLADATLVAVPRGGVIVAGILSYALGRPADAIEDPPPGGPSRGVVVVVDDCAISGSRLRRWLAQQPAERLIVAHLHSHPDLRAAVAAEERVVACIAAADLHDHAPARHGADHDDWVARWRKRSPDDFWTGHVDHVVYPWNEPDVVFWDDAAARARPGWHVAPPQWCLKNRVSAVPEAGAQRCRTVAGRVVPGREVLWSTFPDRVVIADAATGTAVTAHGVAADLWTALVTRGDPAGAAAEVASEYEVAVERVQDDLERLIRGWQDAGLLTAS